MRNIKVFTLVTLVFLLYNSCNLKGKGEVVSETRQLNSFSALHLNMPADVTITTGQKHEVVIFAQSNILKIIKTEHAENTLKISLDKSASHFEPVKIFLTAPTFTDLIIEGSGRIIGDTKIQTGTLNVSVQGSGGVTLDVNANEIVLKIDGSGEAILSGEAQNTNFAIEGSGRVDARELLCRENISRIKGSGAMVINASSLIDASISGAGTLQYAGSPEVKQNVKGNGRVIAL